MTCAREPEPFLLSGIFSKPKDQDDDSDNSARTEKEELSVNETKKVRQNKQTTAPQKSKATALRRPSRACASRNVNLREAPSTSTSTNASVTSSMVTKPSSKVDKSAPGPATSRSLRGKRSSQETVGPPKKRDRKSVQISAGGEAAGIEDIQEGVNILPKMRKKNMFWAEKNFFDS